MFFKADRKASSISDDLMTEVMVRNNRRLFYSFLSILVLANVATLAIKIAGKGSAHLTYEAIVIEFIFAASALFIGFA
ncbi:MAG: chemotaxis protein, partial [Leptonema illini]